MNDRTPAVVDPRRRLWICLAGFVAALLVVFGRAVQLELTQGAGFRAEALRPVEKRTVLPAPRGRILARDGTLLAYDRDDPGRGGPLSLAARPARWALAPRHGPCAAGQGGSQECRKARRGRGRRVGRARRSGPAAGQLCGLSPEQWAARTRQIQARVERIAAGANRRRQSATPEPDDADDCWAVRIRRLLLEDPPPPPVTVAEELAHHVVADDVPAAVVSEIDGHADRYPGTKIVELSRRTYPGGTLAAHVLGHLGPGRDGKWSGSCCRRGATVQLSPHDCEPTTGRPDGRGTAIRGRAPRTPRRGRRADRPRRAPGDILLSAKSRSPAATWY